MPSDIVVISDTEEVSDEEIAFVGINQIQPKSRINQAGPSRPNQVPIFIDSDDEPESTDENGDQDIFTFLSSTIDIDNPVTRSTNISAVKSVSQAIKVTNKDRKGKRKAEGVDLLEAKALMEEFQAFENSISKSSIISKLDAITSEIPSETQLKSIEDEDIEDKTKKKPKKRKSSANGDDAGSQMRQRSTTAIDGGSVPPKSTLSKEEKEALKAQEKAEKQFQKDTAKAAKEAEKSYQRKLAEVNRLRSSKSDTVREIHLYLSSDLSHPKSPISGALPEIKKKMTDNFSELHFLHEDQSPICGVIKFKRHLKARWDSEKKRFIPLEEPKWVWEGIILVLVEAEEIVDKISTSSNVLGDDAILNEKEDLSSWVSDIRLNLNLKKDDQVIIMIKGLQKYYSKTKSLANKEFTAAARAGLNGSSSTQGGSKSITLPTRPEKEIIEMALVELQVKERCFLVHVEKTEDIEDWVYNIAADVAIRPYKLISKSHLNFCPTDGIRKSTNPTETFELMLQEVTGITPSASMGIASEYPTFRDLMESFEKAERRGGVERAEGMLADCEIKTLRNGTANGRKLNKALAKRVYNVFRGEDSLALA
ncbi:uncharacterized protein I206_100683 [Kwoniella pini CBS 10737]|uniref:ERCC4 domain-containing protein n=1 Tax=Kwoniella pini CBS 10737 TaxID=1296096 RepID=A0AAJ8KZK1_9TREE